MTNNKSTRVPIELLRKYDRPGPRYTSYPTAPVWTSSIGVNEYKESLIKASKRSDESIAFYCHIPFCECRCYYCGCNTVITRNSDRVEKYLESFLDEIKATAKLLGERRTINQLHFGGGTPTYLNIEQLGRVLDCFDEHFTFTDDCEKSLEIDPRVTSFEQLEDLASRGFNRVSLGVQDFDDNVQKAIGRIQPYELVENKIEECRKLKFEGINIDLIHGLPRQTEQTFKTTLEKSIQLKPDRVALYSFAYLPSVKANQMKIIPEELPQTEEKYQLFAQAVEIFTAAGYLQIGMDHFALPDDELAVAQNDGRLHRNFMGYTVQASPEMVGIGMSSIGYIDNSFFQNFSTLDKYMNSVAENSFAVNKGLKLTDDDLVRQHVITSLMCNFQLDFETFRQKFGFDYKEYFKNEHNALDEFSVDNFINTLDNKLEITPVGRTFIRNIAMTYDAYLNKEIEGKKPTFSRTI
jgi:oxygen-independent coproporphyrinogen-3 oxidase